MTMHYELKGSKNRADGPNYMHSTYRIWCF